jgi:predicted Zn-dependent protease
VVVDLWAAGDLQGADESLQLAVQHWPQQPQVWRTRLEYLMYSGRPSDALAVLNNADERPASTPAGLLLSMEATAKALAGHGDPSDGVRRSMDYLRSQPAAVFAAAHACAALGDLVASFEILRGYYFGQGPWSRLVPDVGDAGRETSPLFLPPMRLAWQDEQFAELIRKIGLEDYWRRSGVSPDFRHG